MSDVNIYYDRTSPVSKTVFIFNKDFFEKIKLYLGKDIAFYKYKNVGNEVEILLLPMIELLNRIFLKLIFIGNKGYVTSISGYMLPRYEQELNKFLSVCSAVSFKDPPLSMQSTNDRKIFCSQLIRHAIYGDNPAKIVEFIEAVMDFYKVIKDIYKQNDLVNAKNSIIDSLEYICEPKQIEEYEKHFDTYLKSCDTSSSENYLNELQKIILADWHSKLTDPNNFVSGKPFRFLCHSTNTTNYKGDFLGNFVSTSLLTEKFTATYRKGFGFIMDDSNIVLASGNDMLVDNMADTEREITSSCVPIIDSVDKVLHDLEDNIAKPKKSNLEATDYSEIVVKGFNPIAIFCLSNGSGELNENYQKGTILSQKFNLPLIDIDLTLYKTGKDLIKLRNQLIKDIEKLLTGSGKAKSSEYYDNFDYFWNSYLTLKKKNKYTTVDIINLYYENLNKLNVENDVKQI